MATTNYLTYAGLSQYDTFIKQYITGAEGKIKVANTHFNVPSGQSYATVESALAQLITEQTAAQLEVETITGQTSDAFVKQYKIWTGDIDKTKADAAAGRYTNADLIGTIDVPKDFLVKSGTVKTCTTVDDPVTGFAVGDKYLDFVVNSKDAVDATKEEHIYILVKDLVDAYTAAQNATEVQVAISASNEISATLVDGGVTTTKIADANVTTAKIADANVTDTKLAADSVVTAKIKDANVTEAKLATDAVVTAKIKDANITEDKLAVDSVVTAKIKDANVTEDKLATDAVTAAKIKDGEITYTKLASNITDLLPGSIPATGSDSIESLFPELTGATS